MSTLSKESRRLLENTVTKAREEAKRGAAAVVESYGVGENRKPAHLDKAGETLRKKLRAHGRQLGDARRPDESQEVGHLVQECAYEHWHRMLFARFLAENGFLIEPESGLDVDLDFCEERARELKSDLWEVAAGFAQQMLTAIFRADDPVLQLRLPAESRNRLTALLAALPREVFLASDSLGWTYQFWQTQRKKEINKTDEKRGADEIPAVTQLFTEDYMVDFLLDNTLGAWWAGRVAAVNSDQFSVIRCPTEEDARKACALPGCEWKYLRFVKASSSTDHGSLTTDYWIPAAGTFEGWPKVAKELKCLDPCMGSGHFVVAMFERLVALRLAEEQLDEAAAVAAVIRDNLFGLEIDPRCTQIGAFNLALAAWRRLSAVPSQAGVGHCQLPAMNLACSGLAPNTREADWLAIAGDNEKLRNGMERIYRLFQKAAVLGSLINPRVSADDMYGADYHELQPLLEKALAQETSDDTAHDMSSEALAKGEMAVTARGLAKAAEILAGQFTLVATNVPYLGLRKQDDELIEYCSRVHPDARADLATCFVERCLNFCASGGSTALVTPQNWLFLGTYKKLRQRLLETTEWNSVARLGEGGFASPQAAGAFTAMLTHTRRPPSKRHRFSGVDASEENEPAQKADSLLSKPFYNVGQAVQITNPDARIVFEVIAGAKLLREYADGFAGVLNGDTPRFLGLFWEQPNLSHGWECLQSTVEKTVFHAGREAVIFWQKGKGQLRQLAEELRERLHDADIRGNEAWGKLGVAVSSMRSMPVTLYTGELFDSNAAVILPKSQKDLVAVWAFCSSPSFHELVRRIDRATKVTNATLVKVPFDLAHWQKVAAEKYPHGLPKPFSSDPTQWLFNGHPAGATPDGSGLHVAVARLLGYQWPRQSGSSFPDCPALGPDGLEKHADTDGIVCFSQVRDEPPAATRMRALLADAYGAEWNHALEQKLIASAGKKGSKSKTLEDWLRDEFFAQHCDLFHKRPFIWHIWDGLKDGFNVLVNYHKLAGPNGEGLRTLETLIHAYLGDWIIRQKDAVAQGEAGADDRLAAALELKEQLEKIVAGEPPHDLFIRWKALACQPIGWEPDINDGVRLNIRPFMATDLSRGKKGTGLFRAKPGSSLKWTKDRGNEPMREKADFPWFWKWDGKTADFTGNGEFDGNRWNDCHYTTAFKRASRERSK